MKDRVELTWRHNVFSENPQPKRRFQSEESDGHVIDVTGEAGIPYQGQFGYLVRNSSTLKF